MEAALRKTAGNKEKAEDEKERYSSHISPLKETPTLAPKLWMVIYGSIR